MIATSRIIIFFSSIFLLSSCSSIEKNQTIKRMAIAGIAGYGVAQLKSNNKEAYGLMYAGAAASGAAVYSALEDQKKEIKLKEENNELRIKLDAFQKRYEPRLVQQGNSLFKMPVPNEVLSLVDPGEWKRYKMDQWVQDPNQSNVWYRQVEMFEITPPASR